MSGSSSVDSSHADVLVVGAGASGAAFAWRLATAGVDVLCLDRGHWPDPSAYATSSADWESRRIRDWNPNPNVRGRAEDYPILDDTSPIKPILFNGVGGSTVLWSAHTPRFHPSDFRVRTIDGVGVDWPIDYWELEPYYDINDRLMGVCGIHGDPANPPRSPRTTPPMPLGVAGARIGAAFDELGWHWWPSDGAIISEDYDGRLGCNNCGPCELGCPRRSKASTDVTYWPKAIAAGVRLMTGAAVAQVTVGSDGLADGVVWFDEDGREQRATASVVVVAASGIGTPRLLLHSGIANSSGLVGRNLMLHPIAAATGVFADPVESFAGNDAFCLLSQEFYETAADRGFVRGYELQVTRGQGPLVTALGGFNLDIPWGPDHHARFEQLFGHVATVAVTCEDLPNPENRVELDTSTTDRFGVPAARMVYRVDDNSEAMITHGLNSARRVLEAAGCTEVLTKRLVDQTGFHLMGACRMGADPATSVVDHRCRAHDVPNVLVIDASVFATAAAVNPTPTIQAVALRAADQLLQSRREGSVR